MRKKKGFTLVEILAVLSLIAIIMVLGISSLPALSKSLKQRLYDHKIKLLEKSAIIFAQNNKNRIKRVVRVDCTSTIENKCECSGGNCYYIYDTTPDELIEEGYYKSENNPSCGVLDPRDMSTCLDNYAIRIRLGAKNKSIFAKFRGTVFIPSGDFMIKLDKGKYATSISKTELTCTPSGSNKSCNVTLPNITADTEFKKLGWSKNKNDTVAEVGDGASIAISKANTGKTYYAILQDIKGPTCSFSGFTASLGIGKKEVTLTCKDNGTGFASGQSITKSSFTSSNTSIATVTKVSSVNDATNEKSYKVEITTKAFGTVNFTLKANVLKDLGGNGNEAFTSSDILVSEYEFIKRWEIGRVNKPDVVAYLVSNKEITGVDDGFYTIKITGTGDMMDFSYSIKTPWKDDYLDKITSVTIDNGVTNVGSYAFYKASKLSSIKLSTKTTDIRYYSFFDCDSLTDITIPASVVTIGIDAFGNNEKLKTLTFENNSKLTTIGNSAFEQSSIESLTIPASVVSIDNYAFYKTKTLRSLTFENNSKLTTIGDYAFIDSSITSLSIPATVETIGDNAFNGQKDEKYKCKHLLKSLTFASGSRLKSIGDRAFGCLGVSSITFPSTLESIGNYAFNDSYLSSVTFNSSLRKIGAFAFYQNSMLSNVTLNNGLQYIGADAFYGTDLSTLNIPKSVNEIPDTILHGPRVSSITVDSGNSYFSSLDGVLYDKNKTRLINVPDYYSKSILDIPDTVNVVSGDAMNGWLYYGSYGSFTVDIPTGLNRINVGNFSVNGFTINGKATNTTDHPTYAVQDGVLFTKDLKTLDRLAPRYTGSGSYRYTVPSTTKIIDTNACENHIEISTITIPNSVEEIGYGAFRSYVSYGGLSTVNLYTKDNLKFDSHSFIPSRLRHEYEENYTILSRTINVKTKALKTKLENDLTKDYDIKYNINVVS